MPSAIRNIDYVVLICADVARTRRFYQDVLGFPLHRELGPGWIELRIGASILALRPRDRPYDGPAPATGSAAVQLALRVAPAEVDAWHEDLAAKDVPILDPPTDQPWGHRTLFVADPEQNVVEIYADI